MSLKEKSQLLPLLFRCLTPVLTHVPYCYSCNQNKKEWLPDRPKKPTRRQRDEKRSRLATAAAAARTSSDETECSKYGSVVSDSGVGSMETDLEEGALPTKNTNGSCELGNSGEEPGSITVMAVNTNTQGEGKARSAATFINGGLEKLEVEKWTF